MCGQRRMIASCAQLLRSRIPPPFSCTHFLLPWSVRAASCPLGQYPSNGVCAYCNSAPLAPGCIYCTSATNCTECNVNMFVKAGSCLSCAADPAISGYGYGAWSCNSTNVITCISGYTRDAAAKRCVVQTSAPTCDEGYYLDPGPPLGSSECVLCASRKLGCNTCGLLADGTFQCNDCLPGNQWDSWNNGMCDCIAGLIRTPTAACTPSGYDL